MLGLPPQALDMIRIDGPRPSARTSYATTEKLRQLHADVARQFRRGQHDDAIASLPRLMRVVRELGLPVAAALLECKKILDYAEAIHKHAGENYGETEPLLVSTEEEARDYRAELSQLL